MIRFAKRALGSAAVRVGASLVLAETAYRSARRDGYSRPRATAMAARLTWRLVTMRRRAA